MKSNYRDELSRVICNSNWLSPTDRRAKPSSLFTLHSSLFILSASGKHRISIHKQIVNTSSEQL